MYFFFSVDTHCQSEENLLKDLFHITVDEDSNQMPLGDMIRRTGEINR